MSGSWLDFLQPASFRGVPFAVMASEVAAGRKIAEHSYPYRDEVWLEDLGKRGREFSIRGFLVGDDCYLQEISLIAAIETAGAGELVHPSLGSRTVTVTDFVSSQTQEQGRVVTFSLRCKEGAAPLYPSVDNATQNAVLVAADAADAASASDFASDAVAALAMGEAVVQTAVQTVQGFVSLAQVSIGDATRLVGAVHGLVAPTGSTFGRYTSPYGTPPLVGIATASQALAAATTAQTEIAVAGTNAIALAEDL